jgi:Holliday junction resolvase-like predicted endonuclease
MKKCIELRKRKIHQHLVDMVAEALEKKGYDHVLKNIGYNVCNYAGEIDVLAFNEDHGSVHFYEIKCNYSDKSYLKALEQYHKFKEAFFALHVKGVMVTPNYIKRLR